MVEILIWTQSYWRQADLISCRSDLLRENLYELKNDVLFPPPEFQFWTSFFSTVEFVAFLISLLPLTFMYS